MIKANELRIGNWVRFINKTLQVFPGTIEDCQRANDTDSPFKYEPIPLTPEILERCGFHKHNYAWVQEDFTENNSRFYFSIWSIDDVSFKYNSAEVDLELNSSHQLQNLHYALYGRELQFKS